MNTGASCYQYKLVTRVDCCKKHHNIQFLSDEDQKMHNEAKEGFHDDDNFQNIQSKKTKTTLILDTSEFNSQFSIFCLMNVLCDSSCEYQCKIRKLIITLVRHCRVKTTIIFTCFCLRASDSAKPTRPAPSSFGNEDLMNFPCILAASHTHLDLKRHMLIENASCAGRISHFRSRFQSYHGTRDRLSNSWGPLKCHYRAFDQKHDKYRVQHSLFLDLLLLLI